ncbi:pirin family protein [Pseudomonadota bacterium]
MKTREIIHIETGRPTSDGDGVKLTRVFGGRNPKQYDPFLLLDAFGSDDSVDYIGGFPPHPHRGFETVTYMLEGKMLHEDHLGNKGLLNDGDVQWMTAARGIIHSEMPQQTEGRMSGFQLWVNLPGAEKMKDPYYRDIASENIPVKTIDGTTYKVIAGETEIGGNTVTGAVVGLSTNPLYLDIHVAPQQQVKINVPDGHTALLYVYQDRARIGDDKQMVNTGQVAVLTKEGYVRIQGNEETRLLLLAGKPIGEPVAQYGPFVMNAPQEIEQAIKDYREGVLTSEVA